MYKFIIFCCFIINPIVSNCQSNFIYSDREIYSEGERGPVRLAVAPDNLIHLWTWERSGVKLTIFDKNLKYQRVHRISHSTTNITIIGYQKFYYNILTDSTSIRIYHITNELKFLSKTKEIQKKINVNGRGIYYFKKGKNNIFLIQQNFNHEIQKTLLNITAFDSSFNFVNDINLEIEYLDKEPQILYLTPIDDQLILLNKTIANTKKCLAVTKVDVQNKSFTTKLFVPQDLEFYDSKIIVRKDDLILQNQVKETRSKEKNPSLYTYFLKLDSNLEVINSLYFNTEESKVNDPDYLFKPGTTNNLPNNEILFLDFGRTVVKKTNKPEEVIRFIWIDSSLKISKISHLSNVDKQIALALLSFDNNKIKLLSVDKVTNKSSIMKSLEVTKTELKETVLKLTPKYNYLLNYFIPLDNSFYIIPYTNNGKLGLVKIHLE